MQRCRPRESGRLFDGSCLAPLEREVRNPQQPRPSGLARFAGIQLDFYRVPSERAQSPPISQVFLRHFANTCSPTGCEHVGWVTDPPVIRGSKKGGSRPTLRLSSRGLPTSRVPSRLRLLGWFAIQTPSDFVADRLLSRRPAIRGQVMSMGGARGLVVRGAKQVKSEK